MSICYVTATDYLEHFAGGQRKQPPDDPADVAVWAGEERRSGQDRRHVVERRGERARGRRYRIADRRRK